MSVPWVTSSSKGQGKRLELAPKKNGAEHNFIHRLSCSILSYSNGSLLIKPRKASKTFRSILSLLLTNDLGQIKNYGRTELYMYSTEVLRSLPKPRSLFEMRSNRSVTVVESAIKGKGKEECARENGTPLPTIFLTKPRRSIINTWPTQVGSAPLHGWIYFVYLKPSSREGYHNQVKRTILLLYVAQQTRQMKWTKLFGPASSNSQVASWLA